MTKSQMLEGKINRQRKDVWKGNACIDTERVAMQLESSVTSYPGKALWEEGSGEWRYSMFACMVLPASFPCSNPASLSRYATALLATLPATWAHPLPCSMPHFCVQILRGPYQLYSQHNHSFSSHWKWPEGELFYPQLFQVHIVKSIFL